MQKKYEESIACMQRVLLVREIISESNIAKDGGKESVQENSKIVFSTMGQLAELYLTAGQIQFAKELLTKTEETAVDIFGEDSFERGRAFCALAGCLERNGDTEEAIATLEKAIDVKGYGECTDKSELIPASNAYFNLAILLKGTNNEDKALRHFQKALNMKLKGGLSADNKDIIEIKDLMSKLGQ